MWLGYAMRRWGPGREGAVLTAQARTLCEGAVLFSERDRAERKVPCRASMGHRGWLV